MMPDRTGHKDVRPRPRPQIMVVSHERRAEATPCTPTSSRTPLSWATVEASVVPCRCGAKMDGIEDSEESP